MIYTDLVAATILAKSLRPTVILPDWFGEIKFPVRAILEPYVNNVNWRWRMAAREMMARENVLSLSTVQALFNKFFREGQKLFGDLLDTWITRPDSRKRLFGITRTAYLALDASGKGNARQRAKVQLQELYGDIFQRRHDCIHNCDRPRVAPQPLKLATSVLKVIEEIEFLVHRCDEHITTEFRAFLTGIGCPAAVMHRVGY